MKAVLDALAAGHRITDAMEGIGLKETTFWTWKRLSKEAERDLDFGSFYLSWNGYLDHFHKLAVIAQTPNRKPLPLPPWHRSLSTPVPVEAAPTYDGSPFPPPITEASPRVRLQPDSPLVRDLRARAAQAPQHPYPIDARGNRTLARLTAGSSVNDPEERVTGVSYER